MSTHSYGRICADPGALSVPEIWESSLPEFPFLHIHCGHQTLGQRAPGGAGAGRVSAAPAQKAESSSEEARFVIVVPTVPWRSQWEPYTAELSSWPGPARPRAMEFLWAPLLGLCCSLAAADRHIVFWNSSNPK